MVKRRRPCRKPPVAPVPSPVDMGDDAIPRDPRAGFGVGTPMSARSQRRRIGDIPIEDLIEELGRRGITATRLLDMMSLTPARKA